MLARSRALVIGLAVIAFGMTVAGLIVHGPTGGIFLLAVAVLLAGLSQSSWGTVRQQGRVGRLIVIVAFLVLAVVKIAGNA